MKLSTLERFADALMAKFALPGSASPEDQLKSVVANLVKEAGNTHWKRCVRDPAPVRWPPARCKARSRRIGFLCSNPSVSGWSVCRMHGARGGSQAGWEANAFKHGMRTAEAEAERREVRVLIREAREMLEPGECPYGAM